MSNDLSSDLAKIYYTLDKNANIYGEILSSGAFTYEQFERINNFQFIDSVRKWEVIASNFNRVDGKELQDLTATTMMESDDIFYERLWEIANDYDIEDLNHITTVIDKEDKISLNKEQLEYIQLMKEFNDSLLKWYTKHIDGISAVNGKLVAEEFFNTHFEEGFKKMIG